MRRECDFYGLPDDVHIESEGMGLVMSSVIAGRKRAREGCISTAATAAAHAAFDLLVHDNGVLTNGGAVKIWTSRVAPSTSEWKSCLVHHAVFSDDFKGEDPSDLQGLFKGTLLSLAQKEQFSLDISTFQDRGYTAVTIKLLPHDRSKPEGLE
mmetsp:Transcript_4206/g.8495  ORF Transcript_4206/g.8495 Transcript_4206/m.8495 type:complete len:153 (-) Transcript_4206:100-558(-)